MYASGSVGGARLIIAIKKRAARPQSGHSSAWWARANELSDLRFASRQQTTGTGTGTGTTQCESRGADVVADA